MASASWWLAAAAAIAATCGGGGGWWAEGMRGPHHPRGTNHHHHHHQPAQGTKITADTQLLHDVQHIKEDLGEWGMSGEALGALTPEELDFHYFKLHDFDNNTKLDGLEILQAIHHTVHSEEEEEEAERGRAEREGSGAGVAGAGDRSRSKAVDDDDFEYFVGLIDQVLAEDDRDGDGFLSYMEYVVARQREHQHAKEQTIGRTSGGGRGGKERTHN